MVRPFRRGAFSRVGLNVGPALASDAPPPEALQGAVAALLAQHAGE